MGFVFDNMRQFFKDEGWSVRAIGDYEAVSMVYGGKTQAWTCIAQAIAEDIFLFYSVCPISPEPGKHAEIGLFLSYINYTCLVGNFELSEEDGDIRYRTELTIKGLDKDALTEGNLFQQLMRNVVYSNLQNMELYLPFIEDVIKGKVPQEVIQKLLSAD